MSYKNSNIYRLPYELALRVETLCRKFPKHEQYALAQQLRNSSRSIVSNYVEGYIRQNRFVSDYCRFMTYSQGSCDETKFWIEFAKDLGLVEKAIFDELTKDYERVSIMILSVLKKSWLLNRK